MRSHSDVLKDILDVAKGSDDAAASMRGLFAEAKEVDGETMQRALIAAVREGHYEIVKFLVEQQVDINVTSEKTGNTPLIIAIQEGESKIANFLIEQGADVNKPSAHTGNTPLIVAVKQEEAKLVGELLKKGANPNAVNQKGFSPVMFAEEIKEDNNKTIAVKSEDSTVQVPVKTAIKRELIQQGAYRFGALPYDNELKKQGFILQTRLKLHVSGAIGQYKYVGDDPNMKQFLGDNEYVILKTPTIDDTKNEFNRLIWAEFNNANVLQNKESQYESLDRPRLLALNISGDFGNVPVIVNECLFSNKEQTQTKDVEQYLTELGCLHHRQGVITNPPDFDSLFKSMYAAQQQLHRDGLLHLDTACRNFVIYIDNHTVKLIDFGLSLKMGVNGSAVNDPHFSRIPAGFYDHAAQNPVSGEKSIHTDLHSLKLTMIEALFQYINQSMRFVRSTDNEQTLKNAVSALKSALDNIADARKEIVVNVLAKYEPYLTYSSMSQVNQIAKESQIAMSHSGYTNDVEPMDNTYQAADEKSNKDERQISIQNTYDNQQLNDVVADNSYENDSVDPDVNAQEQNTYANSELTEKKKSLDNSYPNDSLEQNEIVDSAYANASLEQGASADNADANDNQENEVIEEYNVYTDSELTDDELDAEDDNAVHEDEDEDEEEQEDEYVSGDKNQLADAIMRADQEKWAAIFTVKQVLSSDQKVDKEVDKKSSSTASMMSMMQHHAPPLVVKVHYDNDNKDIIVATLEQHLKEYSDKKRIFSFISHEREFKQLVSAVKEASNDAERVKLIEKYFNHAYKDYARTHIGSTLTNYISVVNESDRSYHYPRLLALSLQDVYQKCKTPSADQLPGVNKVETYEEIRVRMRNEEKQEKVESNNTPRLGR